MLRGRPWADIAEAFSGAKRRKPELSEMLTFSEQLLFAQHEAPVRIDSDALDEGLFKDRVRRREPLLHRWEFPLDLESAESLFRALCQLARTRGDQVEVSARQWREKTMNLTIGSCISNGKGTAQPSVQPELVEG